MAACLPCELPSKSQGSKSRQKLDSDLRCWLVAGPKCLVIVTLEIPWKKTHWQRAIATQLILEERLQHSANRESPTSSKITPISSFPSKRSQRHVKSFTAYSPSYLQISTVRQHCLNGPAIFRRRVEPIKNILSKSWSYKKRDNCVILTQMQQHVRKHLPCFIVKPCAHMLTRFHVLSFPYKGKPFWDYFNKLLHVSHLVLNNLSAAKLFTIMIKNFNLFN